MRIVGTGTRVLNFLVDFVIIFILAFAVYRAWAFYSYYYGIIYIPVYYFLGLTGFLYYLFFEAIWQRTPGKWMSLSKVVNKQGNKPSFLQILLRSAMRIVGVIIIDSIFLSFLDETWHDFASNTQVVEI